MTTVILSGIVGSTAYGLAGPDSDVDRLAVFVAPTVDIAGLDWHSDRDSHVTTKPDVTRHELGKFVRLALKGNPSITELMWLPEEYWEYRATGCSREGDEPYAFTWSPDRNPHLGDPETAARHFVAKVNEHGGWWDGPHLSRRKVTRTGWKVVDGDDKLTGKIRIALDTAKRQAQAALAAAGDDWHARNNPAGKLQLIEKHEAILSEHSDDPVTVQALADAYGVEADRD